MASPRKGADLLSASIWQFTPYLGYNTGDAHKRIGYNMDNINRL